MQEHMGIEEGWVLGKYISDLQDSSMSCSVFALSDKGYENALGNQELVWLFSKEIARDILEIYNLS